MCRHNILVHNDHGYVVSCKGCGRYQVAFGTSLVTLELADYENFCSNVAALAQCHRKHKDVSVAKKIYIDIYSSHSLMVLNRRELYKLNALLDEAEFNRQTELLLQESNIKPQQS